MPEAIEDNSDKLIKDILDQARIYGKKYDLNRTEILSIWVLLEIYKMHSHLDKQLISETPEYKR